MILAWLILLAVTLWVIRCVNKTTWQRHRLAMHVWHPLVWAEFKQVSYERHLLALVLFQHPWRIYGPYVFHLFKTKEL